MEGAHFRIHVNGRTAFRINFRILIFVCLRAQIMPRPLLCDAFLHDFPQLRFESGKFCAVFTFVRRGIMRNIRKFAPTQNFPLSGTPFGRKRLRVINILDFASEKVALN